VNQCATIAAMTLREAARNRLHWLLLLLAVCAAGLAGLLQQLTLTETRETQALLLSAVLRLAGAGIVACFVVTSMVREAQDGSMQWLLALPIARPVWLLGRLAGFGLFAASVACVAALLCAPFAAMADLGHWTFSLLLELWLLAAFAAFAALSLRHPVPALALVAGFYLLARSTATLGALGRTRDGAATDGLPGGLAWALDALQLLLPRLDLYARGEWLAYGVRDSGLGALAAQAAIYIALLLAAALFDLHRKEVG